MSEQEPQMPEHIEAEQRPEAEQQPEEAELLDINVSDTESVLSEESDSENVEFCVVCRKTKTGSFYYNATLVKNAPVCERCVRAYKCWRPGCKSFNVKHRNVSGIKGLNCCAKCLNN